MPWGSRSAHVRPRESWRAGSDRASVVAVFAIDDADPVRALLAEHDLDHDGELLLRRVIGADGRSRAFVNDTPTGLALLRSIGSLLVEIDGQTETGGLLDPAKHLAMLDDFAGHGEEREGLATAHTAWQAARAEQQAAEDAQESSLREEEYLRHSVSELEALAPESGEEERRAAERAMLLNGQKIAEALDAASAGIAGEGSVGARLRAARRDIERVAPAAGALDALLETLERAAIEAEEAEGALSAAQQALDTDTGRLEAVEERLFSLRAAARKHRTDPDSLPALLTKLRSELDLIEGDADRLAALRVATEAAYRAYHAKAQAVRSARQSAALSLDDSVADELAPIKLARARFSTALYPVAEGAESRTGIDRCRFMLAPDPGADPQPLAKVASGGERARLLLALRVCLTRAAGLSTLVFDEIDRGIGGAVADAVGERLARLAQDVQVLVVTHSPQVAARGDQHYRVTRAEGEQGATARVALLTDAQRQEEIARMLSGAQITEEARAAADSLLTRASA